MVWGEDGCEVCVLVCVSSTFCLLFGVCLLFGLVLFVVCLSLVRGFPLSDLLATVPRRVYVDFVSCLWCLLFVVWCLFVPVWFLPVCCLFCLLFGVYLLLFGLLLFVACLFVYCPWFVSCLCW